MMIGQSYAIRMLFCVIMLTMFSVFFRNRDPITKLSLMKYYFSSFLGSVLWDLSHYSLEGLCVIWRKGLRSVWDLPHDAHCPSYSSLWTASFEGGVCWSLLSVH